MTRSARPILLVMLLAGSISACERDRLTEQSLPTTADAKGGKPGGGGGGGGPVGQPLGTAFRSRATAVNADYAVGRDAAGAIAWGENGLAISLPLSGSVTSSSANGINAAGTIVGSADTSAVVWQPVVPGEWAMATSLPTPPGDDWSATTAWAINDQGAIAGTGTRNNLRYALRWTPGTGGYSVQVVPQSGAEYEFVGYAIANGEGWVAGWVRRNVGGTVVKDGFVWTDTDDFHLLGRLNGASGEARGINATGRVVGWSASAPKGGDSSPVTWTCTEGGCTSPEVLPMFFRNLNFAFSINDAGDIVGTSGLSAILYRRCGTTVTSVTLSPPSGWHQSYGWAVSGDRTAAAGYSFLDGNTSMQATRWQLPAPEC